MKKLFYIALSVLIGTNIFSGCASVPPKTEKPLTYLIRTHPSKPISKGGCWAQYTVNDQTGYLLCFSPTRETPNLSKYISELEEGAFTQTLQNCDIYIGAQLDVPFLIAIGGRSYCDIAFTNPAAE